MKARDIIEGADPRVGELFEFWNAARGANRYPAQADLKLSAIPRLLPNVFVIDVLEGHVFRYRFIGTRIDEHMGVSLTGKVFSDTRSGRLLREITGFFSRIAEQGGSRPSGHAPAVRTLRMAALYPRRPAGSGRPPHREQDHRPVPVRAGEGTGLHRAQHRRRGPVRTGRGRAPVRRDRLTVVQEPSRSLCGPRRSALMTPWSERTSCSVRRARPNRLRRLRTITGARSGGWR
ncbi:MAG: hypothetical protein COW30_11520 [Rhodospirillales bacterium CG15_BIG_FIL_POST_REV_8_21_14_020_66_15]|nr:MAG: hypothetical protein COW30_11520 [Rhodospirillales bacterium CG15_BIG_FIL_POST_REV_8_21_14_020_66_15]